MSSKPKEREFIRCPYCNEEFNSMDKFDRKRDIFLFHIFTCKNCSKTFKFATLLRLYYWPLIVTTICVYYIGENSLTDQNAWLWFTCLVIGILSFIFACIGVSTYLNSPMSMYFSDYRRLYNTLFFADQKRK